MVQISQIEAYLSFKEKAEIYHLRCIFESIIGGLMLEQPEKPINYIKKRLIDTKHIIETGRLHNELYIWPYHPILNQCKSIINDENYKYLKNHFYYHLKYLQDENKPLEVVQIDKPLFSLTEL
ncbi:unnamed protein product [Heterobilharzia americana]|nr:unnamed protein product [Heterobilharzia americana]